MRILENLTEDCVCIAPNEYKKAILKEMCLENKFYHIQFLTLEELRKNLLFEYHPQALWRFSKHYSLLPENGKKILDSLYYKTERTDLKDYQNWLDENNLIIYHPGFINHVKKKKVFVFGYASYEMKYFENILNQYTKVIYIEPLEEMYQPKITEYEMLEQEVVGVAEEISILLTKGVDINHIFLGTLTEDYTSVIKKVFSMFHLPLIKKESHVLYEYNIVIDLLKKISDEDLLSTVAQYIEEMKKECNCFPFLSNICNQVITILNRYYQVGRLFLDIKEIFIYDLKHTKVEMDCYENGIQEVDFTTYLFTPEDYVFLMGANLGEFPRIYEDLDYLSDKEKKQIGIPTSLDMTLGEEQKIVHKIKCYQNVFISYKKKSPMKEYLPSTMIQSFKEVTKGIYQYSNLAYNEYLLHVSLDQFINYNVKTESLNKLYGTIPLYYQTYHNQFSGIKSEMIEKKLPICVLSYTAMQKYFECPFKFYIASILKLDLPFKETPSLMIGNLFHSILEHYFRKDVEIDDFINQELEKISISNQNKKRFYCEKYKKEIKRLIDLMEKQQANSLFRPAYLEESISFTEEDKITFRIYGKIDKIMTFEDKENAYVIVIDYKTGYASSDLSKVIYGMNMQLLLYLYLLSKDERFEKHQLGGAYLESISSIIPIYKEGKTAEDLLWDQSKLTGFSLAREEFISKMDVNYANSSYLKGIRVKKDGSFYESNHLLEPAVLEQLLGIVKKNIDIVKAAIQKGDFKVEPKKFTSEIGSSVSSCNYCKYRDLCYRSASNIKTLKEYKGLEFLKEENV